MLFLALQFLHVVEVSLCPGLLHMQRPPGPALPSGLPQRSCLSCLNEASGTQQWGPIFPGQLARACPAEVLVDWWPYRAGACMVLLSVCISPGTCV